MVSTTTHQVISNTLVGRGEFTSMMKGALQGQPCRVFSSDARVRVRGVDRVTYPDLSIICRRIETDPEDADTLLNTTGLVEVLFRRHRSG